MGTTTYLVRRQKLEAYFDRTAADAWAKLTSDGPVSRIRATVRAGREAMRNTLLSSLPNDLRGQRVLDAGCGTGALAVEAARRGAEVVAIDIAGTLVELARQRAPTIEGPGRIDFRVADMLDPSLGRFDWVVAMDSLIHYEAADLVDMVAKLASRAERGLVFTFAPRTPLLTLMHLAGQLFPRSDRSPEIEPIREATVRRLVAEHPLLSGCRVGRTARVKTAFYVSQALEVLRA
ncbi:MAG: magnesium protoporphyrin IX methyltransferase [Myxococcaceae bacterium]|jgi:magnesium-protoporphyrin O-methyltransferase|nr:magnesium protoporphyrin IX methyltransferase [Myxococcaceae bacterium]MCA3010888.1 magnesium protoporphyrin IX methyltransferase [Myxococcaceae bacterium]